MISPLELTEIPLSLVLFPRVDGLSSGCLYIITKTLSYGTILYSNSTSSNSAGSTILLLVLVDFLVLLISALLKSINFSLPCYNQTLTAVSKNIK